MQEFENEDFLEDEDFGEYPEVDALVEFLKEAPPDERIYVSNPVKLAHLRFCAMSLEYLASKMPGKNEVKFCGGKVDRRMGSLQIELPYLKIDDILRLSRMLELTDAVEFEALIKGGVRIILTFRNLYVPATQT